MLEGAGGCWRVLEGAGFYDFHTFYIPFTHDFLSYLSHIIPFTHDFHTFYTLSSQLSVQSALYDCKKVLFRLPTVCFYTSVEPANGTAICVPYQVGDSCDVNNKQL